MFYHGIAIAVNVDSTLNLWEGGSKGKKSSGSRGFSGKQIMGCVLYTQANHAQTTHCFAYRRHIFPKSPRRAIIYSVSGATVAASFPKSFGIKTCTTSGACNHVRCLTQKYYV